MGVGGSRDQPLTVDQQTVEQAANQTQNAPAWWFKWLVKASGIIGGIVAMITGVIACITVTPICLVAGILMMCIGGFVLMFEAPCCCPWLDFINQISAFSERRPPWQKAALYGLPCLLPFFMCISVTTFFGCALIFVCAMLYGFMALGKKADRQTMMYNAATKRKSDDVEMKETLIDNESHPDLYPPSQ